MVVLIAHHDEGRHVHGLQPLFQIPEGGPAGLHAAHGHGRAEVRMGGGEAVGKFLPAARILVLELHAARASA